MSQIQTARRWALDDEEIHSSQTSKPVDEIMEEPTELLKKKKRVTLSADRIVSNDGIHKIYETFPYQIQTSIEEGQEAQALRKLMTSYKQWAYDLYPKLAFENFIDRVESLGKKHQVHEALEHLREKEANREIEEISSFE